MLPTLDLQTAAGRDAFEQRLDRLRGDAGDDAKWADAAASAVADVRRRGDAAVVEQMRKFTDPGFTADRIRVSDAELDAAAASLTGELSEAIDAAIANVRAYQRHVMPAAADSVTIAGAELGMRWAAVPSAGLLVPGGSAVLFSSVIMMAVPALVAGVPPEAIAVVSPPPTRRSANDADGVAAASGGDVSPITLAVCRRLGLGRVYRVGGPAAVAALAFGTETIDAVDLIAGPGHPVVQAAKLRVAGRVGVDGFYGASEVAVVADATADPARVAADLLAQAEHDPGKCFVVCWQPEVLERVDASMEDQVRGLPRRDAIERSLLDDSAAVLCRDEAHAAAAVDTLACEHVTLAVADPRQWLERVRHGGEFFLGDATPVAAGDYYAGPSHCLPTGTTARFGSGVSVYTFLKRSGTVRYPAGMPAAAITHIAAMARAEGLAAHAASVQRRRSPVNEPRP